jgi:hypothetical protein
MGATSRKEAGSGASLSSPKDAKADCPASPRSLAVNLWPALLRRSESVALRQPSELVCPTATARQGKF